MPACVERRDHGLVVHLHAGRRVPELAPGRARACRRRAGSPPSPSGSDCATCSITSGTGTIGAHMSIAAVTPRSRRLSAVARESRSFASAIALSPSAVRCRGRAPRSGRGPRPWRPCPSLISSNVSSFAGAVGELGVELLLDLAGIEPREEQALRQERMPEQEVVGRPRRSRRRTCAASARTRAVPWRSGGRRAVPPARVRARRACARGRPPPCVAAADRAPRRSPALARQRRGQRALQRVAVHRLVDQEPEDRVLHERTGADT